MRKPTQSLYRVKDGLWIELPAGLKKKEAKARLKRFISNMNKPHQTFNPKAN